MQYEVYRGEVECEEEVERQCVQGRVAVCVEECELEQGVLAAEGHGVCGFDARPIDSEGGYWLHAEG